MNDDDLSLTQAAELLGITRPSLHQLITRGVIPSRRLGHIHVLNRADVLAYKESRAGRQKPGPVPGRLRQRKDAEPGEAEAAA